MFTLRDNRGNVVGFSGRVLDPAVKEAKYINTAETRIYSKSNVLYALDVTHDAIVKANEAILMEGEIDAISSFQSGVSNVVAIKGAALTEGHVRLLKRYTERVVFALDSDLAGDAASRRGIDIAESGGLDMRVAVMPTGKDPDEAVRTDPVGFKKAIKNAEPIYDYFIESACKRYDTQSAFGKKKASEELLPILAKIENIIVQNHYMKKVADTLGVSEDTVVDGVKKVKKPLVSVVETKKEEKTGFIISGPERLELYCLGLLLQGETKELFSTFQKEVVHSDIKHMGVRRVLEYLNTYVPSHDTFILADFAKTLPKELLPVLDEAYLWDISTFAEQPESYAKEWSKTLREVKKSILRRKMREVTDQIKKSDEQEQIALTEALTKLTADFSALEKAG